MDWTRLIEAAFEPKTAVFVFLTIVASVAIISGVGYALVHLRGANDLKHRTLELKEQMLERGLSADEIERVLSAGASGYDPIESVTRDLAEKITQRSKASA